MLKEEMSKALNVQVNKEIYSAYLYLAMAAYCSDKGFSGFANWLEVQFKEELTHAMKMYHFINERGGRAVLNAIDAPPKDFDGIKHIFTEILKHEQFVTSCIDELVDLSLKLKDHATNSFLQWFVNEQVEEEANVQEILDQLNLIGDEGRGLFMLNKELGTRVFVDETAQTE